MFSREARVGLFVLGGLAGLGYVFVQLSDVRVWEKRKTVFILFKDIGALPGKAPVKIAGVEIGTVKDIRLEGNLAKVEVGLRADLPLHRDARASVAAAGVIGVKYLDMTMGSESQPLLKDGETIRGVDPVSYEEAFTKMMSGLDDLMKTLRVVARPEFTEALTAAVINARDATGTLKRLMTGQEAKLRQMTDDFHAVGRELRELAETWNGMTKAHRGDLEASVSKARVVAEKAERTLDRIDALLARVERGEGAIGKLVADEKMGNDLKDMMSSLTEASREAKKALRRVSSFEVAWDYKQHVEVKRGEASRVRADLGLRIKPRPGRFYYLGVNNIGDDDPLNPDPQKKNSVSAHLGRDFGPFTLFGGVTRSKGGVGAEYHLARPLKLTADAFDFNRKVTLSSGERRSRPWVNVGGRVSPLRWFHLGVNLEDALNNRGINTYGNITFTDEDIAYFFGLVGLSR